MTETLDSVLNMAKLEEGNLRLHKTPFNIKALVKSIKRSMKGLYIYILLSCILLIYIIQF
jgi:signal transduction histidine kinase